jgi:hypothetical protein
MGPSTNRKAVFTFLMFMGPGLNHHGAKLESAKRVYVRFVRKGLEGRMATCGGHAVPARDGTPGKPEFFAEQKMRPNAVLKKSLISIGFLHGEALYRFNE